MPAARALARRWFHGSRDVRGQLTPRPSANAAKPGSGEQAVS
jgi:hypothetical protein